MNLSIRDALPADAPFIAQCVMSGMHFYDFETERPEAADIYESLIVCGRSEDYLYSYVRTRIAEVDGVVAGGLLSYPGDDYLPLRNKTFARFWPDFAARHAQSDPETDPGEYYLDTLAVRPAFRQHGVGRALLEDGIRRGIQSGYSKITLVADSEMPQLIQLYQTVGFLPAEKRFAFGVEFQRMIYLAGQAGPSREK